MVVSQGGGKSNDRWLSFFSSILTSNGCVSSCTNASRFVSGMDVRLWFFLGTPQRNEMIVITAATKAMMNVTDSNGFCGELSRVGKFLTIAQDSWRRPMTA
ncbi:hypothetical protein L1887_00150 [Cichorium endivia]|nr:hypothetical protein L1887_00150 [Cichorium endivia]